MTTTPELLALQDLCARLEGAGIEYMLTGSLAMSYYARPRMTRDIDLVVALDAEAVGRLTAALGKDYHVDPEMIADGFRQRRPSNVIHLPTVVKVDLIPRKDSDYRRAEFERRRKVGFAGVDLWIVSPEDRSTGHTWRCGPAGSAWSACSRRHRVTDTATAVDEMLRQRYAGLTGSERALMALQMFESAQRIVLSSLPAGLDERQRRRELCRRFYGEALARQAFPDS